MMPDQATLPGPQSLFTLSVTRGTTNIKVVWGGENTQYTDDSSVFIGLSEEYFLGIKIDDEHISLKLQTIEFQYL